MSDPYTRRRCRRNDELYGDEVEMFPPQHRPGPVSSSDPGHYPYNHISGFDTDIYSREAHNHDIEPYVPVGTSTQSLCSSRTSSDSLQRRRTTSTGNQSSQARGRGSTGILRPCGHTPTGYPEPTWKPVTLTTPFLIAYTIWTASCLGAVLCLGYMQLYDQRRLHAHQSLSYFSIRYAPTLIAGINKIWLASVARNIGWMTPFVNMSQPSRAHTATAQRTLFAPYFFSNSFWWRNWEWLFVSAVIQSIFTTSLAPAFKASFLSAISDTQGWTIHVSKSSAIALALLYGTQLVLIVAVCVRSIPISFGLTCSVASIADQINLVARSNILEDFSSLEWQQYNNWQERLAGLRYRIGYWTTGTPGQYWYGIGTWPENTSEFDQRTDSPSDQTYGSITTSRGTHPDSGSRESRPVRSQSDEMLSSIDPDSTTDQTSIAQEEKLLPGVWVPIFYHPIFIIIWVSISLSIVGSLGYFIYRWHSTGPVFHVAPSSLPVANFCVRFLPAFTINLYGLFWTDADLFYRKVQAFANMDEPTTADMCLFLEYPYDLPGLITMKAVGNGHWKLAWVSVLALSVSFLPTAVGGIFTAGITSEGFSSEVFISPRPLIGSFVLLFIYSCSIPITTLTSKRTFHRQLWSLGDLILMYYGSFIMRMSAFDYPEPDERRIHMQSRLVVAKERYAFGMFKGADQDLHVGFDVANIKSSDGTAIQHVKPLTAQHRKVGGWFVSRRRRAHARIDTVDPEEQGRI